MQSFSFRYVKDQFIKKIQRFIQETEAKRAIFNHSITTIPTDDEKVPVRPPGTQLSIARATFFGMFSKRFREIEIATQAANNDKEMDICFRDFSIVRLAYQAGETCPSGKPACIALY